MEELLSFFIGAVAGFFLYLIFQILKLRKEIKIRKKEMEEQEKLYLKEIDDLRRKLKGSTGA